MVEQEWTVTRKNDPPADIEERISRWMLEVAARGLEDGRIVDDEENTSESA